MENADIFIKNFFHDDTDELLSYLSDCTLQTYDGWSFCIHRVILAVDNLYFLSLFRAIDKERDVAFIPGIKGEILNELLRYIYTRRIHLSHQNIADVMLASDYLLVESLMPKIQKYIELDISEHDCFPIHWIAALIGQEKIKKMSYRFIQSNFETLVNRNTVGIGELSLECVRKIAEDNLYVRGERTVWLFISKWVRIDSCNRLSAVPDLLSSLKIADIDKSLASEIIQDDIVSKNPFCPEISCIQQENECPNSLDVLMKYFLAKNGVASSLFASDINRHRQPRCIHVITCAWKFGFDYDKDSLELYVTFDENVDLWRYLGETDMAPSFVSVIGSKIYMYHSFSNRNRVFNLYKNQWSEMQGFRALNSRRFFHLVTLNNKIYTLDDPSDVQCYIPDLDLWFSIAPMFEPMEFVSCAVAFENKIVVLGAREDDFHTIIQVYDEERNDWYPIRSPIIFRDDFAFTEYHGKLYIIGGSDGAANIKDVEMYDFEEGSWKLVTELPHTYTIPDAIVFCDQMIVYENQVGDHKSPPLSWNEMEQSWNPLDETLPLKDLHEYKFFTIEDSQIINTLVKKNKNGFEKSAFG